MKRIRFYMNPNEEVNEYSDDISAGAIQEHFEEWLNYSRPMLGQTGWEELTLDATVTGTADIKEALPPVPVTFDLTPRGYTVPGGPQRVADAMKEWETATEVLANLAQQYVEMEDMGAQHLYKLMEAAINTRKEKVEALVRAVAGR